jgi:HlyD family secretion protein
VWWLAQQPELAGGKWRQLLPGRQAKPETVPVRVQGGEEILLDLTGYITPKTKVNVSPRVPGVLTELNFEEGGRVEQGAVMARLDDSTFAADLAQADAAQLAAESRLAELKNGALPEEVEQARTAVTQAEDKLELAQKELARMELLKDTSTEAERDQIEAAVSDAKANLSNFQHKLKLLEDGARPERIQAVEAEVAQAKALVAKARVAMENTVINAPISGIVLERHGAVGENVRQESVDGPLFILADLKQLEVQVDVEEQSLGKLQVGQPCRIIPDAYPDKSYEAKICRWQPQVNRARAVVRVVLTITDPDELLLAEMNCRAVILESNQTPEPETYWIPAAAVTTDGGESVVYLVEDGAAVRRVVKLGETKDQEVQILDGLSKTDRVVIKNHE